MSSQKAQKFFQRHIQPIIDKTIEDENALPSVRDRLIYFWEELKNKQFTHIIEPKYVRHTFGGLLPSDSESGMGIVIMIPNIRDVRLLLRREEFENLIKLIYAHEVIHLEQAASGLIPMLNLLKDQLTFADTNKYIVLAESDAWEKTVVEIIKPMILSGEKVPLGMIKICELYDKWGGNKDNEKWTTFIQKHFCGGLIPTDK